MSHKILCSSYMIALLSSYMVHQFIYITVAHLMWFVPVNASISGSQTIASISAGDSQVCIVFDDNNIKCMGYGVKFGASAVLIGDSANELGNKLPYLNIASTPSVLKASLGGDHMCVLLTSSDMKCLGNNAYGQAGLGSTNNNIGLMSSQLGDNLPTLKLGTGLQALQIVTGQYHTCVRVTGNKIKCFGFNSYGNLGYGNTTHIGRASTDMGDNLPFVDLGTNVEVASVHAGPLSSFNCVILSLPVGSAQRIKCWGNNLQYQLGYGDTNWRGDQPGEMGDNLALVNLGDESRVQQLVLGFWHTCALLLSDVLKCWGYGAESELGSGSTNSISATGNSMPAVTIDSGKTIKLLTIGYRHNCIVYNDFVTLKCLGYNNFGQLGQGDTTHRGGTPTTLIPNIPAIDLGTDTLKIKLVSAGNDFTCIVFEDNTMKCFGKNKDGQLGIGSAANVGDAPGEMGSNLAFSDIFSVPTSAPTKSPTKTPTTFGPTVSPTTKSPTIGPNLAPTSAPITSTPSKSPTTSTPTTLSPTISPTIPIVKYDVPLQDCYMMSTKDECLAVTQGKCGKCAFISDKVFYTFRVKVNFVMDGSRRFVDFESAFPRVSTFKDAVKSLLKTHLDGEERILVNLYGQVSQPNGSKSGYAYYDISFIDNQSNMEAAKKYFASQPNFKDYASELNAELNKEMKTTGQTYMTGSIQIDNNSMEDKGSGKGSCGCSSGAISTIFSSSSTTLSIFILVSSLFILFC